MILKDNCKKTDSMITSWFFDRYKKLILDRLKWVNEINNVALIGVSDWITDEVRKSKFSNVKHIGRIYNWIDLSKFFPRDKILINNIYENEKIILGVSSYWTEKKGIYKFIQLSKMISNDTKILLVGEIDKYIKLPNNIVSVKATNDVDLLATYFSTADVFVNFSLEETFGKVTAESLACGTPVVVMNSTANPELINDTCGYVVKNNSVEETVIAINSVLNKGKNHYKDACVEHANKKFNKSKLIDENIQIYKLLLNNEE